MNSWKPELLHSGPTGAATGKPGPHEAPGDVSCPLLSGFVSLQDQDDFRLIHYELKSTPFRKTCQIALSGRTPRLRMEFSPFPQIHLFHLLMFTGG
jgi:hypothetical protein